MAEQFHPLPLDAFPVEARPYIARLNVELRGLFGLEGVLRSPITGKRSDATIVRRADPAVDLSRVTPTVSASGGSGSATIGTPALSFGTANAAGSTTTVLSVNSSIALFTATPPNAVSNSSAVGSAGFAARRDHVHGFSFDDFAPTTTLGDLIVRGSGGNSRLAVSTDGLVLTANSSSSLGMTWSTPASGDNITINGSGTSDDNFNDSLPAAPADGVNVRWQLNTATAPDNVSANVPTSTPAVVLSTIASQGTSTSVIRADAQLAVFDGSAPSTVSAGVAASSGAVAKAARRDHVHALNTDTPALVFSTSNADGAAGSVMLTDSQIAIFGTALPTIIGSSAVGTSAFAARADHSHALPAYGTTGTVTGHVTGVGVAVTDLDTFTGNTGSLAYTVGDIVRSLKLCGILTR